jgi:HEAT repeat protein
MKNLVVVMMLLLIASIALPGCSKTEEEKKVDGLIKKMKSGNYDDYDAAINEFVDMDVDAVEPLIKALNNSDERVRCGAAKALGRIEDSEAVAPLIEALEDMGKIKMSMGRLNSYTVKVCECAAKALANIGDESAVEPLIEMLKVRDSDVRCAAAEALGWLQDERAIEPLIEALNHRSPTIRYIMAESLRNITGEYLDDEYDSWKEWYEEHA